MSKFSTALKSSSLLISLALVGCGGSGGGNSGGETVTTDHGNETIETVYENKAPIFVYENNFKTLPNRQLFMHFIDSYDPDGDYFRLTGEVVETPDNGSAILVHDDSTVLTFSADTKGIYKVEVTLEDMHGAKSTEIVDVTVGEVLPRLIDAKGGEYVLDGNLYFVGEETQIAEGTTLVIDTEISKGSIEFHQSAQYEYDHGMFELAGNIKAIDKDRADGNRIYFKNVEINPVGDNWNVDLDGVFMEGYDLFGYLMRGGNFKLVNSKLVSSGINSKHHLGSLVGENIIKNNIIEGTMFVIDDFIQYESDLPAGFMAITDNAFLTPTEFGMLTFSSEAAQHQVTVKNNLFNLIEVGDISYFGDGVLDLTGNYFCGKSEEEVENLILDSSNDMYVQGIVEFMPMLETHKYAHLCN